MNEPVFCPACLQEKKISLVVVNKRLMRTPAQVCTVCGQVFAQNATLISEDTVRYMAAALGKEGDHLLKELEKYHG